MMKTCILLLAGCLLLTQPLTAQNKNQKMPLLGSWPVSVTPLSLWNSDVSAAAGAEYRFHPSFSVRTAADYIYGNYQSSSRRTSGFRIRQEFRYYIAGNRLINSRSRVWPYIAIAGGGKYVQTSISDWQWQSLPSGFGYSTWLTYRTFNREWFIMGKTGMQTAFGKDKRFLFDISLALGSSNNHVAYRIPGNNQNTTALPFTQTNLFGGSENLFSGKFTAVNFEACFGYRLLK